MAYIEGTVGSRARTGWSPSPWLATAIGLALTLGSGIAATAQPSPRTSPPSLHQLDHTAWTLRDGAPADITGLAQTPDGFLWLSSPQGLFRFDGIRFERYEPPGGQTLPSQNISTLATMPDGTLWVGYRFGGATRIAGGRLTSYGPPDGFPTATVSAFARDSAGTLWVGTFAGVLRLVGGAWQHAAADVGLSNAVVLSMIADRRGAVWLSSADGVYVLPRGERTFTRVRPPLATAGGSGLYEAPDGSVWGTSQVVGLVQLATTTGDVPRPASPNVRAITLGRALFIDADTNAWLAANGHVRWVPLRALGEKHPDAKVQTISDADGLSGTAAIAFLQDREASVWIGTSGGLDRFRPTKMTPLELPARVIGPAAAVGADGTLWVGSAAGPTYRVGADGHVEPATPTFVTVIARDATGDVWLGGEFHLWQVRAGAPERVASVTLPAEFSGADVQAIAHDRTGRLWVSGVRRGVQLREGSQWRDFGESLGVAHTPAVAIAADTAGPVWLGYTGSRVARVNGDSARLFAAADGLRLGTVMTVYVRGARLWVGGELGIASFDGTRFRTIHAADADGLRGISGIVETATGELWINGVEGVTRIPAEEVRHALADSTHRVRVERFDYHDGIRGTAPQIRPQPSAVEGPDGRIWFVTGGSVFWIDPAHVRRNDRPPPVQVRVVEAGGRTHDGSATVLLPARTTGVRIRYTALGLGVPDRVTFRYRLAGSDTGWQDAGARREASYTNLRPGSYRFRVIAANEDGLWNEAGATAAFTIPPTFAQTRAFLALCALAVGGVIWLLFLWRHRQVTHAMRARFEATLAERTRIAQELHDTLLQGFTGVTIQLYAVQRLLASRPGDAAQTLARALESADATLLDARHAVWEMRSPELDASTLPQALTAAAHDAVSSAPVDLRVTMRGEYHRLPRETEIAVLRIGREALTNAVAHASARVVELTLGYEPRGVTLVVRDDGDGFSPRDADGAGRRGHWGLVGMRERAGRVGGTLAVDSEPGRGTHITLSIPTGDGRSASVEDSR